MEKKLEDQLPQAALDLIELKAGETALELFTTSENVNVSASLLGFAQWALTNPEVLEAAGLVRNEDLDKYVSDKIELSNLRLLTAQKKIDDLTEIIRKVDGTEYL